MKKSPQTILFILSGVLFFLGVLVVLWWTKNFHAWKLREHLQIVSPLFLERPFFLVIVATVVNLRVFKRVFSGCRALRQPFPKCLKMKAGIHFQYVTTFSGKDRLGNDFLSGVWGSAPSSGSAKRN